MPRMHMLSAVGQDRFERPQHSTALLDIIETHSPQSWASFNMLGEFDFSDEKLGVEYRSVPNPTLGDFWLRFAPDILPDEKNVLPSEGKVFFNILAIIAEFEVDLISSACASVKAWP